MKFLRLEDVSNIRQMLSKIREHKPFQNHFILSVDEKNNLKIRWDIESHVRNILEQAKKILAHTGKTLQWTDDLSGITIEELPNNLLELLKQSDFQNIFLRRTKNGFVIERYESEDEKQIRRICSEVMT